ncbi:nuclear transport factor 2 family protein [Streptomyces sp. NPDC050145]|uniref:nuclear transport factor 2 family protein n=1 Tax=Streptomyces sp. NPDC050145 TaxID=3365602 RepID=UPI0037A8BD6D
MTRTSVPPEPGDAFALRRLAENYALAVDARDPALFDAQFTADARIVAHEADGSLLWERGGSAERAKLLDDLSVFPRTFHQVGNHVAEITGPDRARGVTYCIAHHLDAEGGDLRCPVRYEDEYERTADGWRIAARAVFPQWYERSETL